MNHSIIIPVRRRRERLEACLWSLGRSRRVTGITDYEVIVVEAGTRDAVTLPTYGQRVTVLCDSTPMDVFNKPRLLNLGIELAHGDVLSFLDADTIVGPRWLECAESDQWHCPEDGTPRLTKLCYRVRYLSDACLSPLLGLLPGARDGVQDEWLRKWSKLQCAREAYGRPDAWDVAPPPQPELPSARIHGNSQWSVRREALKYLRWDEQYVGRGYEDISLARSLWYKYGRAYRAALVTDPEHALLHIKNGAGGPDWWVPKLRDANAKRYTHSANRRWKRSYAVSTHTEVATWPATA